MLIFPFSSTRTKLIQYDIETILTLELSYEIEGIERKTKNCVEIGIQD
jgi:hypothetical protein